MDNFAAINVRLDNIKEDTQAIRETLRTMDTRVRVVEVEGARQEERIGNLEDDMNQAQSDLRERKVWDGIVMGFAAIGSAIAGVVGRWR